MAPRTPRPIVTVDVKKKTWEQPTPLHNRWHPEIPPVGEVKEGELFRVETVDWTGGQILDNDSAEDMKHIDLTTVISQQRYNMNYYSWLDTYTHVKPQASEKLRKATMKSSFSFADFGIFCEF
ncbi:unnamed protein product, partial [Sphagnum balticum]